MATRLEGIVADISATIHDVSVRHYVGRKYLAQHKQVRRVVWVRTPSPIEAPRQAGGPVVAGHRVRACAIRVETVTAFIAAKDDEDAELLLDTVIAAISLECGPSAVMSRYEWVNEEVGKAGETLRVECIALHVTFRMPVADEIQPLRAVISADTQFGTLDDDDEVVPHDPEP